MRQQDQERRRLAVRRNVKVEALYLVDQGCRKAAAHGRQLIMNIGNFLKRVQAGHKVGEVDLGHLRGGALQEQALQQRALQVVKVAARPLKAHPKPPSSSFLTRTTNAMPSPPRVLSRSAVWGFPWMARLADVLPAPPGPDNTARLSSELGKVHASRRAGWLTTHGSWRHGSWRHCSRKLS